MSVSSKFGLKVGSNEIFELKSPDNALDLIRAVVDQFLGESFTTYKPRCPICDTDLCDHEKHMNKQVGECTNEKCGSTIHAADYFGKIADVLAEWEHSRNAWENKLKQLAENQKPDEDDNEEEQYKNWTRPKEEKSTVGYSSDEDFIEQINGEPVFVW